MEKYPRNLEYLKSNLNKRYEFNFDNTKYEGTLLKIIPSNEKNLNYQYMFSDVIKYEGSNPIKNGSMTFSTANHPENISVFLSEDEAKKEAEAEMLTRKTGLAGNYGESRYNSLLKPLNAGKRTRTRNRKQKPRNRRNRKSHKRH